MTSHLFTKTKGLVDVERAAGETLLEHYQAYVSLNQDLCLLCCTSLLSHNRYGIIDDNQWRADYDHVLCKDKYPAFACHPKNFIPTCHICNSKAKGARDLLNNAHGIRRKAFYPLPPFQNSCQQHVKVDVVFRTLGDMAGNNINPLVCAPVSYPTATPDELAKINVWEEVYQVPKRVEEQIVTKFCERVAADCTPENFLEFCEQIARKAVMPADVRSSEWRFWWFKVYVWLNDQVLKVKRDAWELIAWKQGITMANDDAHYTFGI